MDNSYFIFTDAGESIKIQRFHICTWEFSNNTSLIEFGLEIQSDSLKGKKALNLVLFIPWLNEKCKPKDFYPKLKDPDNSRFIFNDSIISTVSLDGYSSKSGTIHKFSDNKELCMLPIEFNNDFTKRRINILVDLSRYNQNPIAPPKSNIYIRFCIETKISRISTRKRGINKSTIIYDIKINEKRNIPEQYLNELGLKVFCEIYSCFCFNIIPNNYDLSFFDTSSLQSVRTLEYISFNKYLSDTRIKKDELIVVFNKKKQKPTYSFFAIYLKERIGPGQYAVAILINFICGILLFIPSFRRSVTPKLNLYNVWRNLPIEIYIALSISLITFGFFVWPIIHVFFNKLYRWVSRDKK